MRVRCPACRIERMRCYFCRQCDTRSVRMPIQTTSCSRRTFPVTSLSIKFVATFNSLGSLRMCRLRSAMADQVRVICNCLRSSSFLLCASICVRARCFVLPDQTHSLLCCPPVLASIRGRHCANYVCHKRIGQEGCGSFQTSAGAEQLDGPKRLQ
eukprot:COSAG02_NODE_4172_length_5671_cov_99.982950_2_plen_155_part_00